jgi:HEAT repeat protein
VRDLAAASIGLAAAGVASMLVLIGRRTWIALDERRRRRAAARLRPLALDLVLLGEEPPRALDRRDGRLLAELVAGYSRRLTGASLEGVAAFFETRGRVDEELRGLHARRTWRRAAAAFALGDMASARAVPALLSALADPAEEVRAAAARSLGRLRAAAAVEPLLHALAAGLLPRAVVGQALLRIGTGAVPGLLPLAEHPEPEERAAAVQLIGLLGGAREAPVVAARLRDTSSEVRRQAAEALGRLGRAGEAQALREALEDRIPAVRAAAAAALGALGNAAAAPDLERAAREDSFEPARAAAHALARLDRAALAEAAGRPGAGPFLHEAADLSRAL